MIYKLTWLEMGERKEKIGQNTYIFIT